MIHQVLRPGPVRADHEESAAVVAAEHAGERATIELNPLQHLTTFAHAHAAAITDVGVPGRAVAVETDAVR